MFQNPKSTYTLALGWKLLDMREFKNYVRNASVDFGSRNQVSEYYDNFAEHGCPNCSALHFPVLLFHWPLQFGGISVWKSCQAYSSFGHRICFPSALVPCVLGGSLPVVFLCYLTLMGRLHLCLFPITRITGDLWWPSVQFSVLCSFLWKAVLEMD